MAKRTLYLLIAGVVIAFVVAVLTTILPSAF